MTLFRNYNIDKLNDEIKRNEGLLIRWKKIDSLSGNKKSKETKELQKEIGRLKYIKGSIMYDEKIEQAQKLLDSYDNNECFYPFLKVTKQGTIRLYCWLNCSADHKYPMSFKKLVEDFNYPPELIQKVKSILNGSKDYIPSLFPPSLRFDILKRDNYRCQICGRNAKDDNVKLQIDHKIPRSKGGTNEKSNLWTTCFDCNIGKSDKDL